MILPNRILESLDPTERAKLGKAGMTAKENIEAGELRSEKDLQKLIANELLRRGIWFTRSAMNKRTTNTVGTPDFLFAIGGRACAVEVKFGNGQVRTEQRLAMSEMKLNGWAVEVVRSFEEFRDFLKANSCPVS